MILEFEKKGEEFGRMINQNPSLEFIYQCFEKWNLRYRSFFILTCEDGSYVQTAGTKKRLIIEYRKMIGDDFKQYTLGLNTEDKSETYINYSSGKIFLKQNEVLRLENVLEVFDSFYHTQKIPEKYLLRELDENYS